MERGEPPGRNPIDAERSDDRSQRPMRISVELEFAETDTGIVNRTTMGILRRPLNDLFHDATVELEAREGEDRPMRKTIALFQGLTAQKVNGHVRYVSTVSVSAEKLEQVRRNIDEGLGKMQRMYRGGIENLVVRVDPPLETIATPDADAAVELSHEAAPGNGESGEEDGDFLRAENSRA